MVPSPVNVSVSGSRNALATFTVTRLQKSSRVSRVVILLTFEPSVILTGQAFADGRKYDSVPSGST